jgi:beta-lactamase class A
VYAAPVTSSEIVQDAKRFDGIVGIYAKNLKTGNVINYQADSVFPTASTSKVVVALAIYKYIYPYATNEKKERYDQDINAMMEVSDNDAFYELLREIEQLQPDALNRVTQDMNLQQTHIHDEDAFQMYNYHSVTTAREMGLVMENLCLDWYLDYHESEVMKEELANSIFRDELPRNMLTKVIHKVGELDDVLCDVGVVDDGTNQILISIYTSTDNPHSYASDFIAAISGKLYNALIIPDEPPKTVKKESKGVAFCHWDSQLSLALENTILMFNRRIAWLLER